MSDSAQIRNMLVDAVADGLARGVLGQHASDPCPCSLHSLLRLLARPELPWAEKPASPVITIRRHGNGWSYTIEGAGTPSHSGVQPDPLPLTLWMIHDSKQYILTLRETLPAEAMDT